MNSSNRQPRPLVLHSDHSLHRYDSASHRDSTPPVGAIMDIQMMHASHLFNSNSVTGKTAAHTTHNLAESTPAVQPAPPRPPPNPAAQSEAVVAPPDQSSVIDDEVYQSAQIELSPDDEDGTVDLNYPPETDAAGTETQSTNEYADGTASAEVGGDQMDVIEEAEEEAGGMDEEAMLDVEDGAMEPLKGYSRGEPRQKNEQTFAQAVVPEDEAMGEDDADDAEESADENGDPEEYDLDDDEEDEEDEEEEDDEEKATDPDVIEEIRQFQEVFVGIEKRFRLINKIGEGTFSSVYKAEDLLYDRYDNEWDFDSYETKGHSHKSLEVRKPKYVAIKKIYVTSSPARIQNELELLHDLTGCPDVVPLITAFRHQDQVVAILPYFQHVDFRDYFRTLTVSDMQSYFRSLFSALAHVHNHGIIHRDIKPTNFLYDVAKRKGVLVDFGLAEVRYPDNDVAERRDGLFILRLFAASFAGQSTSSCEPSKHISWVSQERFKSIKTGEPSWYKRIPSPGSALQVWKPINKYTQPTDMRVHTLTSTEIDIWSAGVILLTILSKRFPFFNSSDDVDATIEIATIFGKAKMRTCAALHGSVFETSIPTIGEKGFTLEKIVLWATNRTGSGSGSNNEKDELLTEDESMAVRFMQECFELDPAKRISAEEALEHEFLALSDVDMDDDTS